MKYFILGKVSNKICTLMLMILLLLTIKDATAQHYLKGSVFSNGAVSLSNESYLVNSTLGQALIGRIAHDLYQNHIGFWYSGNTFETTIDESYKSTPEKFELFQNYPNPFYPVTLIRYALPKPTFIRLEVINLMGQRMLTLVNSKMPAGIHEARFSEKNLPAGYYFYSIHTDEFHEVKRMILIR